MTARLLDPKFRYVPAAATDIRKTFARIRRQQAQAAAGNAPAPGPADEADAQPAQAHLELVVPAPSGWARRQAGRITVDEQVAIAALALLVTAAALGGL